MYADHIVLITDSKNKIQELLNMVINKIENLEIEVNTDKSKARRKSYKNQIPIHPT